MKTSTLLSLATLLAASAVMQQASHAAVHSSPDLSRALEQRVKTMRQSARQALSEAIPEHPELARAWGNGGGRAWGNGGRAWGNGGGGGWGNGGRGFANGGGGGFANGYRGGFANW